MSKSLKKALYCTSSSTHLCWVKVKTWITDMLETKGRMLKFYFFSKEISILQYLSIKKLN